MIAITSSMDDISGRSKMRRETRKIYCAGPLFNPKEREEMAEIASALERADYEVFLPQRDGLEMARLSQELVDEGMPSDDANNLLLRAIFMIDTYHVSDSDGLVLNVNGRVPDEGAMVEAGIAWTLRKPIVIYKTDSRSALLGVDNPLVLGLSSFQTVSTPNDVVTLFNKHFANGYVRRDWVREDPEYKVYQRGRVLHRYLKTRDVTRLRAEWLGKILQEY